MRNAANNKNFYYRTNLVKIYDLILGAKNVCFKNWAIMHNFIRVSSTCTVDRSRLAFKSQRYRVQCLSIQKLLYHSHAKNQLNSYTCSADLRVS